MKDIAAAIAYNDAAPSAERQGAQVELQKSAMPQALAELRPSTEMQPIIDWIIDDMATQEMQKADSRRTIVQFPSSAAVRKKSGMQSVWLDDMQIAVQGDYYERPGVFTFDGMRQMVEQTPILNGVIMQRIRQIQRFCRPQKNGKGPGFKIALRDNEQNATPEIKKAMKAVEGFMVNSGWENDPRQRMRLKRDGFPSFMAKAVRDSLTMDSFAIETEVKRKRSLGLDGMYVVDGATIRLCAEQGYRGSDEVFALQVVQGNIRAAYQYDELVYVPRNPRSDVACGGYGLAETELLVRVVTGFLNAFTYNTKFFDSNAMPRGVMHMYGSYSDSDIAAFKRYWNNMVKGVNNAWTMPVMISKDSESGAKFEQFGEPVNELMFGKWMTLLASMICAVYGMAPEEINIESFSTSSSSLGNNDTEEKLVSSKDKGLRPTLSYFEGVFSDFIVQSIDPEFEFQFTGLDEEAEKDVLERKKLILTVDELRADEGLEAIPKEAGWGSAPLNPSLISAWQQAQQAQNQDFGQPGGPPGAGAGGQPGGPPGADPGQPGAPMDASQGQEQPAGGGDDFGQAGGADDTGADFGSGDPAGDQASDPEEDPKGPPDSVAKAFNLPVFRIEA
jgi:hypothetical protein